MNILSCSRQERALDEIGKAKRCHDPPTEALIKWLAEDPELATCVDRNGYTLLHHAVRITSSVDVLKLLANDTSLSAQNNWKRTALHQACGFGRPAHVVLFLAERSVQALERPDEYGLVPLHYACWKGMDEVVIAKLVEVCPSSVRVCSGEGETPLLSACESESRLPTAVYARLLREWPIATAIVHTTDDGRRCIPLKKALLHQSCDLSVLELLLTHSVHVLIGLAQALLHETSSAPNATKDLLRETLMRFHPELGRHHAKDFSETPNCVLAPASSLQSVLLRRDTSSSTAILPATHLPLLESVFHDPSIQVIVRDYRYQTMISCLTKISISSPSRVERCEFVSSIFEFANGNLDCLYLSLRDFPDLFVGGSYGETQPKQKKASRLNSGQIPRRSGIL